ncbi:matrix metalloproteinase-16-like [Diabrotica virgifera virgifera]|uniref:Peptidase metallopeptidase domain-containing protein n=1 Tax=Diabrotica virgifera virgifera TaxID=50390 RepID=A0ABM5IY19_DIAVI|nr:matrix metalloproteinase-16-like [Diabrotica virgifera virgifera]
MFVCLHALLLLSVTVCAENSTLKYATSFLKRFGYLNASSNAISSIDMALVEFQERYNLPVTGTLNTDTMNMMNKPRCSVGDNNYAIHSKWNKTTLSWYFPQAVSNPVYIHLAEDAFVRWEKISNLKFKRVIIPSSKPDITITVVSNNHSFRASCQGTSKCPFNFDGPGKVLAHAYYPGVNDCIEIHLDANERWYAGNGAAPDGEANFLAVLLHEIGHTLGLEHSNSDSSIMYPWYQQDVTSFGDDDKKAMSRLYGQTEAPTSMSTAPVTQTTLSKNRIYLPTTPAINNICLLQYPDFMFLATSPQFPNYRMYVGSDKYLWKFDLNEMRLPQHPELITDYLPKELRFTQVSHVFQNSEGHLITVSNNRYYDASFPNLQLQKSFMFPSIPTRTKINALFQTNSGQTYLLYNDNSYIEFNEAGDVLNRGPINDLFPGIPNKITSAFRYTDGFIYFFQNNTYYKYSEYTRKVVAVGTFSWGLFGIPCPEDGLLKQLKTLLNKIVTIYE